MLSSVSRLSSQDILEIVRDIVIEYEGGRVDIPESLFLKTVDIFQERVFVFFGAHMLAKDVLRTLFEIQLLVFLIDAHYESQWKFSVLQITPLWDQISACMERLGLGAADIALLLQDIRAYEHVEQEMRQGRSLRAIPIEKFYFLKSCDVRLQRNLMQFVQENVFTPAEDRYTALDILGEILDDLDDIDEDSLDGVYNGNRFLSCAREDFSRALHEYRVYVMGYLRPDQSAEVSAMAAKILEKLEGVQLV